ncbi:hypothetical protein JG688_00015154 [Phytophthora aleatoria]|uniref:ZSWIM1/3 RNaseH-like domain-containing protein n=1 Tax=Phytophthora aleatoria TaxID=2496075 RepID=A0A8J5M2V4_9STRA|nr:hypothetical protein JG688_00015154 [Phytophthora aleatoria]
MCRMVRKFPKALCIDVTRDTNINRYRLFSFMVAEKIGSGAFVQYALLDGETKTNMMSAFSAYKKINVSRIIIKVVIISPNLGFSMKSCRTPP